MKFIGTIALFAAPCVFAGPALAQRVESHWLTVPNLRRPVQFGSEIALDGDRLAVAGQYDGRVIPGDTRGRGVVHVFRRTASGWEHEQAIHCPDPLLTGFLSFGWDIDLEGDTLIIGDRHNREFGVMSGAVWVYEFDGAHWRLTQRLDRPYESSGYGTYLAIRDQKIAVGVINLVSGGLAHGGMDIWERTGGSWNRVDEVVPLPAPHGFPSRCGNVVRVNGDVAAVGCLAQLTYQYPGGSVRVFERLSGSWVQTAAFERPRHYGSSRFGEGTLDLNDEWLVVGDARDSVPLFYQPCVVWVYRRMSNAPGDWALFQELIPSGTWANAALNRTDRFGESLELDGDRLIVGAPGAPAGSGSILKGQAYVFEFNGSAWIETERLTSAIVETGGQPHGFLGHKVQLDGPYAVSSDYYAPVAPFPSTAQVGRAYVYENPIGQFHCAGVPHHLGVAATLSARGSDRAHVGAVDFFMYSAPSSAPALLLGSPNPGFIANPAGMAGNLCMLGPHRGPYRPCDPFGLWTAGLELPEPGAAVFGILPGSTWYFQVWYRQAGNPPTSNLSEGISIQFE